MPSLLLALAKLRWSLNTRGVAGTVKTIARATTRRAPNDTSREIPHPFDQQHGVDTSGLVTAVHLASGHPHDLLGTGYCGIPPSRFRYILDRWISTPPQRPVTDYCFVDIGCGKGRALMLATGSPFAEIIGVELNPGLAGIATGNLATWQASHPTISPTRVICQDALEFALPSGPCLIYLYNPFAEPIATQLIDRIERSFSAEPRALDILYYNPACDRVFANHPRFRLLWTGPVPLSEEDARAEPFASSNETCSIYRCERS